MRGFIWFCVWMAAAFFVGWALVALWFVASAFVTPFGGFFGLVCTGAAYVWISAKFVYGIYPAPIIGNAATKATSIAADQVIDYFGSDDEPQEAAKLNDED